MPFDPTSGHQTPPLAGGEAWLPYPSLGASRSQTLNETLKLVGVPDDDTVRVTTRFEPESVACGTADWSAEAIAVCVSWVEASSRELSKTSRARLVSTCRRRVVEMVWSAVTSSWSRPPSPTTSTTSCDEDLDDREATLLGERDRIRGWPRAGATRCAPGGSREDRHEGIIGSNGGNP